MHIMIKRKCTFQVTVCFEPKQNVKYTLLNQINKIVDFVFVCFFGINLFIIWVWNKETATVVTFFQNYIKIQFYKIRANTIAKLIILCINKVLGNSIQ